MAGDAGHQQDDQIRDEREQASLGTEHLAIHSPVHGEHPPGPTARIDGRLQLWVTVPVGVADQTGLGQPKHLLGAGIGTETRDGGTKHS